MKKIFILSLLLFSFNGWAETCIGSPVKNRLFFSIVKVLWDDCRGELTFTDGKKYIGPFENSEPNGRGRLLYNNDQETIITGQFIDGKINGFAILRTNSEYSYFGQFKNGLPHGQGNSIINGQMYEEYYMNGKRITLTSNRQSSNERLNILKDLYNETLDEMNRQNNARALIDLGSALLRGTPPKVKHGRSSTPSRLCPDGTYVSGGQCNLNPDGSYTSGKRSTLCPDGTYVSGGQCNLNPDGSYTSGKRSTLCPDGTYVSGTRCNLMPDGSYIGSN